MFAKQTPDSSQTWKDLEAIRRAFPGKVLVKGIMHPEDARIALSLGIDRKQLVDSIYFGNGEAASTYLHPKTPDFDPAAAPDFNRYPRLRDVTVLETVLERISSALESGESVKISGFGTFSVRQKGRRVGRNPKTGETPELDRFGG